MPAPERFGRYRVTSTLGAGAMGDVYAAVDEALGREVAIKVLKPQRNELAAALLDERFRQEARAIAALTHPNVVVVFDIGLDADPPYLVMERVAGPSLKDRLARGKLDEADVRALGIQIARAIAAAHERGIVHRDVKPANILEAADGQWKLADFGVAHVPDSSLTMTGQFIGSPAYAPPEALLRGQTDRAGDVFGLGAVLYHAAAGTWPRLEQTSGALLAPLPPIASVCSISEPLARAIDRAVRVEPGERPSANELADELAHDGRTSNPMIPRASTPAMPRASSPAIDAPHASLGAPRASSPVIATAFPTSSPGVPLDSTSSIGAVPPMRWKPWAIGGAIFVLLVLLIASSSTRGGSSAKPTAAGPAMGPMRPPPDEPIQVVSPPMPSGKAAKDWNKVLDQLEKGHFEEARKKLGEWERKHGATSETEALRAQIADRPDEHGPPGHRPHEDD